MKSQSNRWLSILAVGVMVVPILAGCAGPTQATPAPGGATAVPAANELKGNIAISGAFALYPMVVQWGQEFQKIHPGVQFDVSAGGAGKGMTDALTGAVDMGMVSRNVTPQEESQGAYTIAVVKDAVFPVVNSQNPVLKDLLARGVSKDIFIKIFITGEITTWGQVVGRPEVADAIHVFTRSDSAGAADAWAGYMGKKQADLTGIGVNGDPGISEAVAKDPLGIGYNNLAYAFDAKSGSPVTGLAVVPIDKNGDGQADASEVLDTKAKAVDAIANGKYPSPPARLLNLVTKGKPTELEQAFLLWVLTDGQKFVSDAGFVALTPDQLAASLQKLK